MNRDLCGLLERIERSSELLLYIKTCVEPINDCFLMLWAGKDSNCAVLNGDHGLIWIIRCEVATGSVDTAGWPMV